MTIKEMASAIRNHIVDGLHGITNEAFSTEQLIQEIILEANAIIAKNIKEGIVKPSQLYQRIDNMELLCKDISNNCEVPSMVETMTIEIPRLSLLVDLNKVIGYLGTSDNQTSFTIYYDEDYKFHKYRLATANKPYVWINAGISNHTIYFFNLGKFNNLKFISISAMFENPYDILNTAYADQFKLQEFYAPAMIQQQIINSITERYVRQYRQLHTPIQPTTLEKA